MYTDIINMSWIYDKENIEALTIKEYNDASSVYSVLKRDSAIIDKGLKEGYYGDGLDKSDGRCRMPELKNTSRVVTMKAIEDTLFEVAKQAGGDILEGYKEFVYVNNCSSRHLKYREEGGLWDLNNRYFTYVRDNRVVEFSDTGTDAEDYDEYRELFKGVYGSFPVLYGDWEFFYLLWNGYLYMTVNKFFDDLYRLVRRRRETPNCKLGPCESCMVIVDCDIYGYKEMYL